MAQTRKVLVVEDATIIKRNFSGKKEQFNNEGNRYFLLKLDDDLAKELIDEGWNVKKLPPRDNEDDGMYILTVTVRFDKVPPSVFLIRPSMKKKKIRLDEDTVNQLDWTEISTVDVAISSNRWEMNGKTGIKAYLKSIYVTVVEDEFASKYDFDDEDEVPFD